jgi:hypothetical protein
MGSALKHSAVISIRAIVIAGNFAPGIGLSQSAPAMTSTKLCSTRDYDDRAPGRARITNPIVLVPFDKLRASSDRGRMEPC